MRFFERFKKKEPATERDSNGLLNFENTDLYYREGDRYRRGGIYEGKRYNINPERAKLYFDKALDCENSKGYYGLAVLYEFGLGVRADTSKSRDYYNLAYESIKKDAERGNRIAQYIMGCYSFYALGVIAHDETTATHWWTLSADQGYTPAIVNLACCYLKGQGIKSDLKEAVRLFKEAAKSDDLDASYYLGLCFEFGLGVEADGDIAIDWYKKAAAMGHLDSISKLTEIGINI